MKTVKISILALLLFVFVGSAWAGPIKEVVKGTGEVVGGAANYVGETVGDTASSVGKSVKGLLTKDDPASARNEIDTNSEQTLNRLFALDKSSKGLFEQSYGYAVFDSRKSAFLLTAGGGSGVAIEKITGQRTYMNMLTLGVNVGAGIQYFNSVFLFETPEAFNKFVNSGWEADTTANATFGRKSLEAQVRFTNGMAYYQLSNTGIMLNANIAGTKYSKDSALNAVG